MMLKSLKHALLSAPLVCAAVAACSKTPAPEDAYVNATVGAGANPILCGASSTASFFSVGQTNSSNFPQTVPSGQNSVTVECTVSQNGDGFNIALNARLPGSSGGSFTLTGHVNASGGTGLTGFFSSVTDSYRATDCTVTYTYNRLPVAKDQTVASGQIFGHVDCPTAVTQGTTEIPLPDGGSAQETCDASADFLFQNCAE
jgi:hypothetical protein